MTRTSRGLAGALCIGALVGCGDDDAGPPAPPPPPPTDAGDAGPGDTGPAPDAAADASGQDAGADADAGTGPALEVVWAPCRWGAEEAECADVSVPVDWNDPSGPSTTAFVKRRRRESSTGQIWLLSGGPGGSGRLFEGATALIDGIAPALDVYVLDHRGTGGSNRLDCAALRATPLHAMTREHFESCVSELQESQPDAMRATTVSAAARDLGALIDATRRPGDRVVVLGLSYGTYWAQRYLQLHPDQPDAVILDGLVPMGELLPPAEEELWLAYDRRHDRLGRELLRSCADDPACAERIRPDAITFMTGLRDGAGTGCPAFDFEEPPLSWRASQLIHTTPGQVYLLPLLYRAARCTEADQDVIAHFVAGMTGGFDPGFSWAAFFQLGLALAPAASVAEAEAFEPSALFSTRAGRAIGLAALVWPALSPDPIPDAVPDSDVPILMLNGTIDPQTSIEGARAVADRLAGPNRYLVELPHTLHVALWASQSEASHRGEELPCGAQIAREFIASPEVAPDTSCLAGIIPISIGSTPEHNLEFLGVEDAWENAP